MPKLIAGGDNGHAHGPILMRAASPGERLPIVDPKRESHEAFQYGSVTAEASAADDIV